MTLLNITINPEDLIEAVLNSNLDQYIKSQIVLLFNACMEMERDNFIQAKRHEQTPERQDYRNGYYKRSYTLNVGTIELTVPRTRSGEFSTQLFSRYQRMDKAFVLALVEMVVQGVSTRKVTKIVEKLIGESVSSSLVSTLCKELDEEVEAFRQRSLTHAIFDYVYVDAMYIKVREGHRVISKAVYIAQGVREDGFREIIGMDVRGVESKAHWQNFFRYLKERGLQQPKLVISDAHEGLKQAILEEWTGTSWQRCSVHFLRNILTHFPRKNSQTEREALRLIFRSKTPRQARERRDNFIQLVERNARYDKAVAVLESGFEDAIQYTMEPEPYQVSLRTTNSLERINREIRRRDRVIGIYPNQESAMRLIGSVLLDLHQHLQSPVRRFLSSGRHTVT